MINNAVVANILGTIGTFLWCVQLVPQIWHNYRKKNTDGLPASMMLIWATSSIPFGAYAIVQDFAIPLQIQPQMFALLAVVTWGQILYYDREASGSKATTAVIGVCLLIGILEALLVFACQIVTQAGISWHMSVIGIGAAILFVGGFFPTFVEIWYRRGRVAGISFGFLTIDCLGALFSLSALIFQHEFDYLGGSLYLLVVIIEFSIASSHFIWLYRTRKLHKKARELGVDFDDLPEAAPYQRQGDKVVEIDEEHHTYRARRPSVLRSVRTGSVVSIGDEDDTSRPLIPNGPTYGATDATRS